MDFLLPISNIRGDRFIWPERNFSYVRGCDGVEGHLRHIVWFAIVMGSLHVKKFIVGVTALNLGGPCCCRLREFDLAPSIWSWFFYNFSCSKVALFKNCYVNFLLVGSVAFRLNSDALDVKGGFWIVYELTIPVYCGGLVNFWVLVDRESGSCKHVSILMGFNLKLKWHWLSSCAGVVHLVDSELFFMLWVPS